MSICTDDGNDLDNRAEALKKLGWTDASGDVRALEAWADATMIARAPDNSDLQAWEAVRSQGREVAETLDVDYALMLPDAFIWMWMDKKSGFATCNFAQIASPATAHVFSEAEALGTLEDRAGTYQARISRTVKSEVRGGWITVIYANALGGRGESPDFARKLLVTTTMAFVTGPLEAAP